jgi:hypothetical protein
MTTRIELETSSYNQSRYSKPWIARVDFSVDPRGEFRWGTWVGDHNSGSAGLLVIDADEGDIIARGPKDFRGNNGETTYYQVREGALVELDSKAAAYRISQS